MRAIFVLAITLVTGCSLFGTPTEIAIVEETVVVEEYHPPFPRPIEPIDIEFVVLTKETIAKQHDNYVYMGMSWADYLSFARYMQDVKHKFSEYVDMVCYYRDIVPKDDICVDRE